MAHFDAITQAVIVAIGHDGVGANFGLLFIG